VLELKILERPPSMLRNVDGRSPGGAGAEDSGAPTINAKKHQRRSPWEVAELKIREHPPSMLRNIDDGPLRGGPHPGSKMCVVNLHMHDR
jgi:hypothetical protein